MARKSKALKAFLGELTRIQELSPKTGKPIKKWDYWKKGLMEFGCFKLRFPIKTMVLDSPLWKDWKFNVKKHVDFKYYCMKHGKTIHFQQEIYFNILDLIIMELTGIK